jgi:2-polyprenyl-6-methoxyphenol hydroxylase-like FAD-dependent oxidoreductase
MAIHTEVLIAGAGPAGLMLAGDLAAAGVRCTVAERRTGESNLTRAFAVHPRTLEELDARGIADELIAGGTPVRGLKMFGQSELSLGALPSRFPFTLVTPQYETERVLAGRARAAGAEIRTGAEVIGLRQDGDLVEVEVQRAGSTQRRTIRAAYVVGADGANSTVRSAVGLPFPGHAVVRSVMLADVPLAEKPDGTVAANSTGDAFALIAPFGDGWFRVVAWSRDNQQPDDAPVGADEIRATVRQVFGTDYGMGEPRWLSRFHSDERQVPQYRVGRVFLAGDAAHVHSPAGGQGMNTGIQDAANLGWKLAAVAAGWAGDGLLDTYQAERHPVGEQVLRTSSALLRGALLHVPAPLAAGRSAAVRTLSKVRPLANRMAGAISGLAISYPAPRGAHPLTGRRVADLRLADGRRLYEALRSGRFLLVTPAGGHLSDGRPAGSPAGLEAGLLADSPAGLAAGLLAEHAETVALAQPARATVLVRPDAYIGWASDDPAADPATALARLVHAS